MAFICSSSADMLVLSFALLRRAPAVLSRASATATIVTSPANRSDSLRFIGAPAQNLGKIFVKDLGRDRVSADVAPLTFSSPLLLLRCRVMKASCESVKVFEAVFPRKCCSQCRSQI